MNDEISNLREEAKLIESFSVSPVYQRYEASDAFHPTVPTTMLWKIINITDIISGIDQPIPQNVYIFVQ